MGEFSLDVDSIRNDVEKTLKQEEEKLQDSPLKSQAETNADAIFDSDLNNPYEREKIIEPIEKFGMDDMDKSSKQNELLSHRLADFSNGGEDANNIGEKILQLDKQLQELDPGQVDFSKKGILKKLQNPVKKYFGKYQKAEPVIADIIDSLENSRKVLENDNVTLLHEENALRETTNKLIADVELGKMMDKSIESQITKAEMEGVDSEKVAIVKEEILFPLRQRVMDLQQMVVINQQGIISLNTIRKNNKELIRGVNRAKNVTVTALKTGVMAATALYDQKIVMDKINILNDTTSDIIMSTSQILRQQGSQIQKSSASTMISTEVLQEAFAEAIAAVEEVSTYKQLALPKMKETIDSFNQMAIEGQKVVERIETADKLKEESAVDNKTKASLNK